LKLTVYDLSVEVVMYLVGFQSRLGRTPWIKPYTDAVLPQLVARGVKKLAVLCPAFVADCLETLEEIAMRAKEDFVAAGGEQVGGEAVAERMGRCAVGQAERNPHAPHLALRHPRVEPLAARADASVATACHPIDDAREFANPNVVKAVLDARGDALYFSRAGIPFPRDGGPPRAYRHVGIYAYRVAFLRRYAGLAPSPLEAIEQLEQLRVLWHGERIATVIEEGAIPPGVDTPADLEAVLKLLR